MIDVTRLPAHLTHDELKDITGKKRYTQMCEQLDAWGYKYEKRIDGSPVVSRLYYEERMGVKINHADRKKPKMHFEHLM